ncbi:MAG: DNA-binding protein [Candidatus Levybacteria bacterium]|nr:DNA-binding protein [Candidatus Levybacteria bacterium]
MRYSKKENNYILRLFKGEELISSLLRFCTDTNTPSAYVSGIGSVESAVLGFYHLDKKEYRWKSFEYPMEIVSLTGNITQVESKPFAHIHTVLSDPEFETFGGHMKSSIVGATCEIFIFPMSTLVRDFNEETGLMLLSCENEAQSC